MRARRPLLLLALGCALLACGCRPGGGPAAGGSGFDPDSITEAYRRSVAALAFPFTTRAFELTPEGDVYNGDWFTTLAGSADGVPCDAPGAIAYEERWRPVARWRRRSGEVRWDFEAVALPAPAPADTTLFASLEVRATNLGRAPHRATLTVTLEPRGRRASFVAFDAAPDSARRLSWAGRGGRAQAWGYLAEAAPGAAVTRTTRLPAGGSARWRMILPTHPAAAAELAEWARVSHGERVAETRAAWERLLARGASFELGDPQAEAALRAALVVLLSCRERRGGAVVPVGNPFQYRDVWARDGARAVAALAVAGFGDEAREAARGLTLLRWPNGAFLSQQGQLDGTGQVLWALGQTFLRPAPDPGIARLLPAVIGGWRWCERQRDLDVKLGAGPPGLLPAGDPRDNEDVRAQLVGNDAWSIAGYAAAVRLLRAVPGAGQAAIADSVERARTAYLAAFTSALARSKSADVPPSWTGAGLDWGNLAASVPCGVLAPRDPRCRALAHRVWARSGGPGLVSYRTADSLSYYLGADLGTWALLAGERAAADSVLGALLRYRTASGGAAELFHRDTLDFGDNLPPHTTGAAALVTLVRNCLLYDEGDTLQVTLGPRDGWWRHGALRRAPTRWGAIDLEFRAGKDSVDWRWVPVPVWTALHLPAGAVLAMPPASPLRGEPGGTVVLAPPGFGLATARLRRPGDEPIGRRPPSKAPRTSRPSTRR